MADIPGFMLPHTITVTPQRQTGGQGWQASGPPVVKACRLDRGQVIRQAGTAGETVMSAATVFAALSDAAAFPINAKAVDSRGRQFRILAVTLADDANAGGWEHLEAALG